MEFSSNKHSFTFFLVTLLFTQLAMASSRNPSRSKTDTEFIRTSCFATTYPKLCFSSLSVHANAIQSSPQLLASTALSVSLSSAKSTSTELRRMATSPGHLKPREAAAMRDCIEELGDTVDELEKSMAEMEKMAKGNPNFDLFMSDVQTWVSAALTDENTCTDGFDEKTMSGELKIAVKGQIVNVAQLTSNALALINKYAMIHG